jgi:hypothetical protein
MSWAGQVDFYCERLAPGFWAEPVNALTNAAFVVVGMAALVSVRRTGNKDPMAVALASNAVLIGIGSFLFHTFATGWARLADALPIQLFILAYFGAALHRFAGLGRWWSVLAAIAFFAASMLFTSGARRVLGGALNWSEMYLPAFLAIVGIGGWLARHHHPAAWALMAAGGLFALSIFFRTLDMEVCLAFPLGTHFFWHLLNAAVIGVLLAAFIAAGAPGPRPGTGENAQ